MNGDLAQLVEHRLCKAGVRGSIPLVSTVSSFKRDLSVNIEKILLNRRNP
jgi:hypothetical protein